MSITGELREWGRATLMPSLLIKMETIADRIDSEHQKAEDEWRAKNGDMWLKGYAACHEELMEGHPVIAADLEKAGWVELPKDADGVPIRVGDVIAYKDNTKPKEVVALAPPSVVMVEDGPRYADMCRHYHAPTVEDVLTEFGIDWEHESDCEDRAALLKEYAKRLKLAEGEDA